jgi:hypothetical protein
MPYLRPIKDTYAQRWRRLFSHRRRADSASVGAAEVLPTPCFGPVSPAERLALEGIIAGQCHGARGASGDLLDVNRGPWPGSTG